MRKMLTGHKDCGMIALWHKQRESEMPREYVIESPAQSFTDSISGRHIKRGTSYWMQCGLGLFNEWSSDIEKAHKFSHRSLAEAAMRRHGINPKWHRVTTVEKATASANA
jgi:hypothetical protein